jgi:hypothetical protein
MRCLMYTALVVVCLSVAGCVSVDLGQASKDWADVGKSFAESYKAGATPPAQPGSQQQPPLQQ